MKKIVLSVSTILFMFIAAAQVPQALNYQAVARNNVGQIVPSQSVGVRFSIHEGTANGNVVYQETHTTLTNNFGLFTLAIGRGTVVSGTFSAINWGTGDKFLQVEIAPAGGNNYTVQGTTQFLSVPYSLYSAKTNLIAGNNTILVANGTTITGNYQPANNTILINGNTIAGNYAAANNTIVVNGNTIAGNYAAANNTILVNGNTIAGNYQAANNTVLVTGNTIAGNYQAGTGIAITGNTIAHNFVAGTGINITGNVISATGGNSLWTTDAAGIHNTNANGHVGVNRNATSVYPLTVHQNNSGVGNAIAFFESDDTYHGAISIQNNISDHQYSLYVGANPANYPMTHGSFSIGHRAPTGPTTIAFVIDGATNFVGIGPRSAVTGPGTIVPRSVLTLFNGDVNIEQIGSGIILKSPNGQCWRVTIDNGGNLIRTSITCP
jgi:hypothetical protein